jgi:hypothetical protein
MVHLLEIVRDPCVGPDDKGVSLLAIDALISFLYVITVFSINQLLKSYSIL